MDVDFVLETPRLLLRRWRPSDAAALFRHASNPEVSRRGHWPRHESPQMSEMVIREFFMPNPDCLAMIIKSTGETAGCIGLVPQGEENFHVEPGMREAGYWIGEEYWNRGLTTEAMQAFIDHCRHSMALESVLLTTDADNFASQRVAAKCGFSPLSDFTAADGTPSKAFRLEL